MRTKTVTRERRDGLDSRDLAVETLLRLETSRAPLQAVLHAVLSRARPGARDASLCAELCYGVVRREIRVRWLLRRFFKDPGRLPPRMRCLLCTAIYALIFLDAVPAYATVDWAVETVKKRHGTALARVANGGLRSLCREGGALKEYDYYSRHAKDSREADALFHSLPPWICGLWEKAYGSRTAGLLMVKSSSRPASGIRVNMSRADQTAVVARLTELGAVRLGSANFAFPAGMPAHENERSFIARCIAEGKISRQGPGSQAALEALEPAAWPEPIWDACAGQGSKTCALLERGKKLLAASDVHMPRLRRITGECARLRIDPPHVVCASILRPPLRKKPATILLDVPCSGLGTLASRPDIRRRRTREETEAFIEKQRNMLDAAYALLPTGGNLAYITCTCNPAENENQIESLLARRPGAQCLLEWSSPPDNLLLEGMYAALLRKE
jgi:16S rRNA (cytosine967-C5)-methyltransferase